MKSGMHMVSSYCGEMLSVLLLSVISSRGSKSDMVQIFGQLFVSEEMHVFV